ncbi:hypothetical protein [Microcella humidisoli]|uniref:Uncharacterized protein n=1 Tax=Microcella humidisoli TaxID=2963406 RepID=A0ABY5FWU3_9MICO|nr:hypothetical protein [Microcella humidisoli]UTT62768.1 hypothetical protein NNL39_01225 [Microcella humidisoli]
MARTALSTLGSVALLAALALAGCATGGTPSTDPEGGTTDGGAPDGESTGGALDCSAATTDGYDLFLDPALTVDPVLDVYPLEAGDTISFTYAAHDDDAFPTYGWLSTYITSEGDVAPSTGSFFFDEEGGVFTFVGPEAVAGIDGGPYTGFLDIEVTVDTTTTVIGRLCVQYALTE